MLSVIISTSDELSNSIFWETLSFLNDRSDIQSIVIINQKQCRETFEKIIKQYPNIVVEHSNSNNRAARLNEGLAKSKHDLILYQHPRTYLEPDAYDYILNFGNKIHWGAFEHQFDFSHPVLQFTSWYSNNIRLKRGLIAYLDHCIFINKKFYDIKEITIPEVDIFEDTILSQQLSKKHPPTTLPHKATTSSIRFKKNGVFRQSLLNQALKLGFYLGIDHQKMNKLYEKGLSLNSKYTKK